MGSFLIDVQHFNTKATSDFFTIRKKVMLEIGRRVILKTPVDKGGARGGWQSTIGAAATTNVDRDGAGIALNELVEAVGAVGDEETMFLSNLMPYIAKLEYGGYPNPPKGGKGKTSGGFSTQAPQGMVRVTLAEFEGIVRVLEGGTKFSG